MIPSDLADTTTQALESLADKTPPKQVAEAVNRLKRVVTMYASDGEEFNPVDFTESDLSEGTKVFEEAARKEVDNYFSAARDAHAIFRGGMNVAQDSKDRTKCRVTLITDLAGVVAEKL